MSKEFQQKQHSLEVFSEKPALSFESFLYCQGYSDEKQARLQVHLAGTNPAGAT